MAKYAGGRVEKGSTVRSKTRGTPEPSEWGTAQSKGIQWDTDPLEIPSSKGDRQVLDQDELRSRNDVEKLSRLQPVYGTHVRPGIIRIADGATQRFS